MALPSGWPPRAGDARGRAGSCVVDLRPLQAAAEVHVDALPLGERVEHGVARLAVAVSGASGATEGQVSLRPGGAMVHVDDPGLEVTHGREGAMDVGGEDRRRETVA